jgi:copper chaperone CopZ
MKLSRPVTTLFSLLGAPAFNAFSRMAAISLLAAPLLGACQNTTGGSVGTEGESVQAAAGGAVVPRNLAVAPEAVTPAVATAAVGPVQTAELMVEGTSCASCAVTIRHHLHQLAGIGDIREGSTKQHLLVEFNPALVTAEQLVKAVSEAGYDAQVLVHSVGAVSASKHGG